MNKIKNANGLLATEPERSTPPQRKMATGHDSQQTPPSHLPHSLFP